MKTAVSNIFILALALGSLSARAGSDEAQINQRVKEAFIEDDLSHKRATIEFQPAHSGQLEIQESHRKEVFQYEGFQTPPAFGDSSSQEPDVLQVNRENPSSEIYNHTFREWQKKREERDFRRALNRQFHENLKKAGVEKPELTNRDLAAELDQLELSQKTPLQQ